MTTPPDPSRLPDGVVWSVGEVAAELGLPASTLRTWERRYGLAPSIRTNGGHRRYSPDDVERMRLLRQLVDQGVSPAEAAQSVLRARRNGVTWLLQEPTSAPEQWLGDALEAAHHYEASRLRRLLEEVVGLHGTAAAWDRYVSPLLQRVGEEWAAGTLGVDSEHLVSEAVLTTLRGRVHGLTAPDGGPVVVMACAEEDQHALPVVALQAALADQNIAAHAFGQRMPAAALASVVARTKPRIVFLWASLHRPPGDRLHRVVSALSAKTTIILGGPGWRSSPVPQAVVVSDLSAAVASVVNVLDH